MCKRLSEVERTDMLKRFYPDHEVESAYGIDYSGLYAKGYRGVIFDIDNTLVPHGAPADGRARELFRKLRESGSHLQTMDRQNISSKPESRGRQDMRRPWN